MVTIGGQRYLPFEQVFTVGDGDEPYNTEAKIAAIVNAAPAGVRVKIWQRTTRAQELVRWGFGDPRLPQNQGIMTMAITDESVADGFAAGKLRIVVANASEIFTEAVRELDLAQLHAPSYAADANVLTTLFSNRQDAPPFPSDGA